MERYETAEVGDIVEKIEYANYQSNLKVGDQFVVIDVYNGDWTAVVMTNEGKIETLCFPEEYKVVGTVAEKVAEFYGE